MPKHTEQSVSRQSATSAQPVHTKSSDNGMSLSVSSPANANYQSYANSSARVNYIKQLQSMAKAHSANTIQLTKKKAEDPDDYKPLLKRAFGTVNVGTGVDNVGVGGGGLGAFITPSVGTRHHIYPKSSLIEPAKAVSKTINAFNALSADESASKTAKNAAKPVFDRIAALAKQIGIDKMGDATASLTTNYYWNRGLYFFGVASGERADDPGSSPEPFKPRSIDAGSFDNAKAFGKAMESVKENLSQIGSSGLMDIGKTEQAMDSFATMNASAPMFTRPEKGSDWTITPKPSGVSSFDQIWGESYKRYTLNKTGVNDYNSYGVSDMFKHKLGKEIETKLFSLNAFPKRHIGTPSYNAAQSALANYQLAKNSGTINDFYTNLRICKTDIKVAETNLKATVSKSEKDTFTTAYNAIDTTHIE